MRKTKSIPYQLIQNALDSGMMDTLAYAFMLRSKFTNPVFYNYTVRSIAKILKCSPTTAAKHIKIMIAQGWAREHHGNLCLTSTNTFRRTLKTFIIKVPVAEKKSLQVQFLRGAIMIRNYNWQQKQVNKKAEIIKHASNPNQYMKRRKIKYALKRVREVGGIKIFEKSFVGRVTMSNKKIGSYFKRSQSTGARYQKIFNRIGIIKSEAFFEKRDVSMIPEDLFWKINPSSIINGFVFIQSSNSITVSHKNIVTN